MDTQYGYATRSYALNNVPQNTMSMPTMVSSRGQNSSQEKAYLLGLGIAGIVAYFLYKADYAIVGAAVVGLPFLMGCIVEPRIGIYVYCFWQAWDSAISLDSTDQGQGLFTLSKPLAFLILGTSLLHIKRRPIVVSSSRVIFGWTLAYCAIAMLSSFWSYDILRSMLLGFQMLTQWFLAMVILAMVGTNLEVLKRMAFWTIIGGITTGIYLCFAGMEQSRFNRASLSDTANPATVANSLALSLSCIPIVWGLVRSRFVKLLLLASANVMLFGIVGTGTRAVMAGILLACIVGGVLTGGRGRAKRIVAMAVVLVVGYVVGAIAIYSKVFPGSAGARLAEFMMLPMPQEYSHWEGTASGREAVWELAMKGYHYAGFMGSGIGCSAYANREAAGIYLDVHSNLVSSLVELGPLGLIIFIGLHVVIALQILKLSSAWLQLCAWSVFLPAMVFGSAHSSYSTKWFWLPITFLVIFAEIGSKASSASRVGPLHGSIYTRDAPSQKAIV